MNKTEKRQMRAKIHKDYADTIQRLKSENSELKCRIAVLEQQKRNDEQEIKRLMVELHEKTKVEYDKDENGNRVVHNKTNEELEQIMNNYLATMFKILGK